MSDYTENKTPNLIINTLEDSSKLSEITVGENEIVLVPDDIEEEIAGKVDKVSTVSQIYGTDENGDQTTYNKSDFQDTLTAGSNISIVNNVISATAQESFFRGKFSTWTSVPTDPTQYYPNYKDETTPTSNDYMVVEDSSAYIKPGSPIKLYNEPSGSSVAYARFVFGVTDVTLNHVQVSQAGETGVTIGTVGNQIKVTYNTPLWKITPLDVPIIVDGVEKPVGEVAFSWHYAYPSQETLVKEINFAGQGGYEGTWRFSYQGDWSESGKNGWVPEYQVEGVLPTADSSTAGIAKLYTTTGSNTDGAIDQNGTTTAINTAVSTHNTASNAHSNIRGTANGIATLDSNAKVPLTQINDALLGNVSYQGQWDAATNTPYLQDPSGGLPTGYNAQEYITRASSNAMLDTGIYCDANCEEVEVEFTIRNAAGYISGTASGVNAGMFCAVEIKSSTLKYVWVGNSSVSFTDSEQDVNITAKIDTVNKTYDITLNGVRRIGTYNGQISPDYSFCLLGFNYVGTYTRGSGELVYARITKDGTLVSTLVPALQTSNTEYGMYDTVRNTFLGSITVGSFIGGGAITTPKGHYYITSVAGTQFGIHFEVGDWVIADGVTWGKVLNTDAVSSVEGRTGNVTVINDSASTGATTYTWSADKLTTEFANISVPDATDQVKGIAKLYTNSGSNTDGSMTQNAITNYVVNGINTREISEGAWIDVWFSSYWSGTRVYLEDIENQSSSTYATYLTTLATLYTDRSATMATLKIPYNSGRTCFLYLVDNGEYYFFLPKDGKRLRVYDDNGTIKFEEAMFKDFALMSDLPTVNDSTITITQGGVTKGSFTLNQASGDTIALDAGGGDVEWAIYGTTTHQQISDWANAGKEVLVKSTNGVTIYRLVHVDVSEHIFTTANLKAISYCYVTSQNAWYSSSNNLQVQIPAGTAGNVITYTGTAGSIGSATLATVATSGDYTDLTNKPTIPTVNDSTITITQGGVTKGSFTLNQSSGDTIVLDAGGVYHPELLSHEWDDHERTDASWVNALTFSWQNKTDHLLAYNELEANISGKSLTSETVAGVTIQFYQADNGRKICPDTEESNVASIYTATGVAWYYIIDTTNERFKLPRAKHNKYADSLGVVGTGMSVGLFDGTDNVGLTQQYWTYTGHFLQASTAAYGTSAGSAYASGTTRNVTIGLTTDASKSGVVAPQTEDTDQYKYLYFYVGNYTQTALENTAGLNAELFNNKVDLNASNLSTVGKSNVAKMAMPSTTYTDLTLAASGTQYTAPANGYFTISKYSNGTGQYVGFYCAANGLVTFSNAPASGYLQEIFIPVQKGQKVTLNYTLGGTTQLFRFIYAEGEI